MVSTGGFHVDTFSKCPECLNHVRPSTNTQGRGSYTGDEVKWYETTYCGERPVGLVSQNTWESFPVS